LADARRGMARTAFGLGKYDGPLVPGGRLFYLGRYQASGGAVVVEDATDFYDAAALAAWNAARSGVEEIPVGVLVDGTKRVTEIVVPTETYDRPINVWSRSGEHFGAAAIHYAGG